eukprot:EST41798.1 Hypothetical protein SS50377_18631 [Spironucleus salmonicida]
MQKINRKYSCGIRSQTHVVQIPSMIHILPQNNIAIPPLPNKNINQSRQLKGLLAQFEQDQIKHFTMPQITYLNLVDDQNDIFNLSGSGRSIFSPKCQGFKNSVVTDLSIIEEEQ